MKTNKAILIAGMHRSGTSALTRVLNLLGGSIASDVMPPNCQNFTGYWECSRLTLLHDQLLENAGSRWDDWRSLPPHFCEQALKSDGAAGIRKVIEEEFKGCPVPIIKDPRLCRFVPLWKDLLEQEGFAPHVVIPLRNPIEVAHSLHKRDKFTESKGYLLWLRHVLEAERNSRDLPRAFVWYEDLLNHWERETNRLASELQLCWPYETQNVAAKVTEFLQPDLRHNCADSVNLEENTAVTEWVRQTYRALVSLSQNADIANSQQQLDQVTSDLDDAERIFKDIVCEEVTELQAVCAMQSKERDSQRRAAELLENRLKREIRLLSLRLDLRLNQHEVDQTQHEDNRRRVLSSDVFDAGWYLATYDDVRNAGMDAATHYLKRGAVEGRDASAEFSTLGYLDENPDCAAMGQNPVLHALDKKS